MSNDRFLSNWNLICLTDVRGPLNQEICRSGSPSRPKTSFHSEFSEFLADPLSPSFTKPDGLNTLSEMVVPSSSTHLTSYSLSLILNLSVLRTRAPLSLHSSLMPTRSFKPPNNTSYEHQLLSTLSECSLLVEKYNRELVPHFLTLNGESITISSKLPKSKLVAWLVQPSNCF